MWYGVLHFNFILIINFKILAKLTSTVVLVLKVSEGHSVQDTEKLNNKCMKSCLFGDIRLSIHLFNFKLLIKCMILTELVQVMVFVFLRADLDGTTFFLTTVVRLLQCGFLRQR